MDPNLKEIVVLELWRETVQYSTIYSFDGLSNALVWLPNYIRKQECPVGRASGNAIRQCDWYRFDCNDQNCFSFPIK